MVKSAMFERGSDDDEEGAVEISDQKRRKRQSEKKAEHDGLENDSMLIKINKA